MVDLAEAVALTAGTDLWRTVAVPSRGLAPLQVTDGPNGARGEGRGDDAEPAVCFPVATALAASWDLDLVADVGSALAAEARGKGAGVLLAPTVNLHRHVLAGRNFECFSEDPFLTARLAVAYVSALQARGVGASVKHFAANETEDARHWMSSVVDERTLREVYLQPFEAAVREAGAWSVMTAYNRINGTYASDHRWLVTEVLRGEWGFAGAVTSDWGGTMSLHAAVEAGVDLEMPGPPGQRGAALAAAVEAGELSADVVSQLATRVADLVERADAGRSLLGDGPDPAEVAHRAAAAGVVLLANDGLLPLPASGATSDRFGGAGLRRVALIGPHAADGVIQGGGSSQVRPEARVGVLDALRARFGPAVTVGHHPGCSIARWATPVPADQLATPSGEPGARLEVFADHDLDSTPASRRTITGLSHRFFGPVDGLDDPAGLGARTSARYTPRVDGPHELGLAAVGAARVLVDGVEVLAASTADGTGESFYSWGTGEHRATIDLVAGRPVDVVVELRRLPGSVMAGTLVGLDPPGRGDDLAAAAALAAEADVAVVVVGLDADWESEGNDRRSLALPGAQDDLVRAVAAANPNTVVVVNAGSPVLLPWADEVAAVLVAWYPGQAFGPALAELLAGDAAPSGRLPTTFPRRLADTATAGQEREPDGSVRYREGLHLGHRHHDRTGVAPHFAFGHGLTYTTFAHGTVALDRTEVAAGDRFTASVEVTNVGDRPGVEVVQCYLSHPATTVDRPARELRGFARLALAPGQRATATIDLGFADLARWDPPTATWTVDAGPVLVELATSAASTIGSASLTVAGTAARTAADGRHP